MDKLLQIIEKNLDPSMVVITVSNPRRASEIRKITVRPVLLKGTLKFQEASYSKTQVFHRNQTKEELMERLAGLLPAYRQLLLRTETEEISALISKKGKVSISRHPVQDLSEAAPAGAGPVPVRPGRNSVRTSHNPVRLENNSARLSHNRKKNYLLPEGTPVPFLQDLGVMTAEGKIVRKRYDKYRQINRFLEFIEDVLPSLPADRELTILDFGCGKSYLTFAMYYYLREIAGRDVSIIGLDLKKDVIRSCSRLAESYGYDRLHFLEGAIEDYEELDQVDMVVTLHACDTATDYALEKAVRWGARVILSVPCCQHELNGQLHERRREGGRVLPEDRPFAPLLDYGILQDRFAALATDGIRAKLLEEAGYETRILEFIDMEHTPKNLLIRAVKGSVSAGRRQAAGKEVDALCRQFGFAPCLRDLLRGRE